MIPSAHDLHQRFASGEMSAEAIVDATLKRIKLLDPKLGAFLAIYEERSKERARALDLKRKNGQAVGKLAGVPIAIKDNIHVHGEFTTCASKFLQNYRAPFDATVTRLLEEEGALIIGKTNQDEFAMGGSGEHSAYFPTKNPWDLTCIPGGSSSGSAAAVSARLCPLALGTDTGGSIRQPAAFTGIVGFKPTYGRVSRYGLVAYGSSLDQIGPMAYNVKDAALVMDVIGRHCEKDATSRKLPPQNYSHECEIPIREATIGVPWKLLEDLNPEIRGLFEKSLDIYKQMGVKIVPVDLDLIKYSIAVYYILATAEASTNLARFDGIRYGLRSHRAKTLEEVYLFSRAEGFGYEVKKRILLGTFVLSSGYQDAYYNQAQCVRAGLIKELRQAFGKCQMIALPTAPSAAYKLGASHEPLDEYLQDLYTIAANLAGLPAISVPMGFTTDGKPVGLQLMGPELKDGDVLSYAHAFEKATPQFNKIPPGFGGTL